MRFSVFPFLALLMCSCTMTSGLDGKPLAQMTFDHVKPFPVYVASYEPVDYPLKGIRRLPDGFVSDPSKLIFDYLQNRFEAFGHQGKLKIEITDSSIYHEVVDSKHAVGSLIGLGKQDHYHVKAVINVNAYGVHDYEKQGRTLTVSRDIYISEHVSLVERERLQMQAMDNMVDDLDISLRQVLTDQLGVLR